MKQVMIAISMISMLSACNDRKTDMVTLSFEINAPLGPMDCLEIFEDPLYAWLAKNGGGPIGGGGGGGSSGNQTREFFVDLKRPDQVEGAVAFVEGLGVPVGSHYMIGETKKISFGDRHRFVFTVLESSLPDGDYIELATKIREVLGSQSALLATRSNGPVREFWTYAEDKGQIDIALATLKLSFPTLELQSAETGG